jgi:hypothetical protein
MKIGILVQIVFIIAVMFLFPAFGTMDRTDLPVQVDGSWYSFQMLLALLVVFQHIFFEWLEHRSESNLRSLVVVFYIMTFALTIFNISRFQ